MEQEGAVHQGIVSHLQGGGGVNPTSITWPRFANHASGQDGQPTGDGENTGPGP